MALLLDRRSMGQPPGIIAADLAAKIAEVEAAQKHLVPAGSFDIGAYRLWFDEFARVATAGFLAHPMVVEPRSFAFSDGAVKTVIYSPRGYRSVIVFVHGGGWVIGSVATHDHICRWLATATGSQVVSIDYSLAPEHVFPTAVDETAAVLAAVTAEQSTQEQTVFLAGDSAGANIAAMALLSAGTSVAEELAGFISIYGAYSPQMNLSSHKLYGDGRFGLSEPQMRWFWNLYAPHLSPDERSRLSPLNADLSFFPPTLCIAAECDLLLDDTLGFYSSLANAGKDVSLSLWPGITHGALHFVEVVDSVTSAANSIVHYIEDRRRALGVAHPAAPASLVRVLRSDIPGPLTPTVMARPGEAMAAGSAPFSFKPIESAFLTSRSRLHGSVAHTLATKIIGGSIAPGTILPNDDSASASFGVSRSAYREAVRTLAAKGLVVATPKIGTRVSPRSSWRLLDPDVLAWHFEANCTAPFVRSLFEMRKVVEPSAAALAALRRNEEDLTKFGRALEQMARRDPNDRGWHDGLLGFHEALLQCCDNEVLAAMWPAVQVTLEWAMVLQTLQPKFQLVSDPVADHAKVFQRIASRDAEGALQEMAYLIDAALTDTLANLSRNAMPSRTLPAVREEV